MKQLLIMILCIMQATLAYEFIEKEVCVVGAGPAGILAICTLIDRGIQTNNIAWIDPHFCVGQFGQFYQSVRMNTGNNYNMSYFNVSTFLKSLIPASILWMSSHPSERPLISQIVEPLQYATNHLLASDVSAHYKTVELYFKKGDRWVVCAEDVVISCKKLILCMGRASKQLDHTMQMLPLELAMSAESLRDLIDPGETIAVFGAGASGQLVVSTLQALGNSIVHVTQQGAANTLTQSGTKTTINHTHSQLKQHLSKCTKAIYAIGYEPEVPPLMHKHAPEDKTLIIINAMALQQIATDMKKL